MSCALGNSAVAVLYPILTRYMLNDLIPNRKFNLILIFGGVLLVAYVLKMLMKYSVDYFGHMVGTHMQADMRKEIFSKLEKLPFSYFDNNETGQIMSRITNDLQEISELAHHGPETLVMTSFSLIFSLFYLSSINITLALIVFACSPLLVIITVIVRKKHLESSRKARRSLSKINGDVNSSISGIRITKAFNNADKEIEKFETGNKAFVEAKRGQYFTMAIQHASTVFVTDIFNVVVLISGGIFLYNGQITFGDYSTFIVSVNMFTSPILQLVQWMEQFDEGVTGFERFCEILDLPIEEDKKEAITLEKVNGDICFDNVSFSYNHDEDREVLDHISFVVPQGKTVALVGPSGGGKTTICHLLPKFYHPDAGVISIDGTDIEDITMESLRENIGIVQQDVFLFSGSFADNIAYGRNDASFEEIVEAAKKANIYDYIMSLPASFDTQIGERGVRLSGGQKQRLSIARVFLKNPSILILDEATSALDNTTEALIQEALNTLKKGRTTIVVAHRLSTIKNADQILVVANGKIRESGTHNELIKDEKGIYKKLYESQFLESDFGIDSKMMMS
ncbi:MAG: ABC transporter ATP-binding protein [Erysipelotrichaceae bacterium]|nr:ABC transporter ATP-binding protein [Erysipelotrichaceae bacterium]